MREVRLRPPPLQNPGSTPAFCHVVAVYMPSPFGAVCAVRCQAYNMYILIGECLSMKQLILLRTGLSLYVRTCIYIYIYIYMYVCMYVCMYIHVCPSHFGIQ